MNEMARKPVPAPFTLRLSPEERTRLERDAGDLSLSAYVRSRLFSDTGTPRNKSKRLAKDKQALAQILAMLGSSRLANNLNQLAKAANMDTLLMTPDVEKRINLAYEEIRQMRQILLTALGLKPETRP